MISPARQAANRRNALKSSGPKSPEGKAKSSLNALKHGLCAETVVLPGEDHAAFEKRRADLIAEFDATGTAARLLADRAAVASWRLDRCARAESARVSTRMRHAAADLDFAQRQRAEDLGAVLLYEPVERGSHTTGEDPLANARFDQRDLNHPAKTLDALTEFAQGVDWLLAKWTELLEILDDFGYWYSPHFYAVARLMGLRPEEATDNREVSELMVNVYTARHSDFDLCVYFDMARRNTPNCPIDIKVVELRAAAMTPESPEAARAWLRAMVEKEMARLQALKDDGLDETAQLDMEDAANAAAVDVTKEGVLARRYETACERELHRSLTELRRDDWPEAEEPEGDKSELGSFRGGPSGPVPPPVKKPFVSKWDCFPREEDDPKANEPGR